VGHIRQGNQVLHPHISRTLGKRYLGTSVAGEASCGKAQCFSRYIKGGIIIALEEGLDGVTVALAPAKTARGRTGKASDAAVAMLRDTKRIVRLPVRFQTPWTFAIGPVLG
jgi:hypothetical protein